MSVSLYEQQARSLRGKLEKERKTQADEEGKAAKAEAEAYRLGADAGKSMNTATANMKLRQADSKRKDAMKAREKAAKASAAVAKITTDLNTAERKLAEARAKERKKEEDERLREQKNAEQKRKERERREEGMRKEADRRREREMRELRTHADSLEVRLQEVGRSAPEKITVLFIASSPEDQPMLRLDREVREIRDRVRASRHRESIDFDHHLATQVTDLLQALNETRPHIVHFSGHGNQDGLAFENDDGETRALSNAMLAQLLSTSSDRIRLAVFNSCHSSAQAELACDHIDAAIGMDLPVEDQAAKIFAGQFYNSLGFGNSRQRAFKEACFQVEAALGRLSGDPRLHVADGVDAATLVLVAPEPRSSCS